MTIERINHFLSNPVAGNNTFDFDSLISEQDKSTIRTAVSTFNTTHQSTWISTWKTDPLQKSLGESLKLGNTRAYLTLALTIGVVALSLFTLVTTNIWEMPLKSFYERKIYSLKCLSYTFVMFATIIFSWQSLNESRVRYSRVAVTIQPRVNDPGDDYVPPSFDA